MGLLETIIIVGAPWVFTGLWKLWGFKKVPKSVRGPLEAVAKAGALAALKSHVDTNPPPLPAGRGKK